MTLSEKSDQEVGEEFVFICVAEQTQHMIFLKVSKNLSK